MYMKFDIAVIGGGPAGLSASIFTTRAGLKTICFEKLAIGGQATFSYEIANYPGFEKISGFDLTQKMYEQAKSLGTEFSFENIKRLSKAKTGFKLETKNETYNIKKVIIACGTVARKLNLENEQKFTGKGVSYCASCDGGFFKNKPVAVIGGGDTAFQDVDYLTRLASKVYLINRSEKFKAGEYKLNKAKKYKNVEIITSATVEELVGEESLQKIKIKQNGKRKTLKVDGLFVAIGHIPDLSFLDIPVDVDHNGYIIVDKEQKTNVKNLFACGDITSKHFKQVITACSDGAIAGNSCIGD